MEMTASKKHQTNRICLHSSYSASINDLSDDTLVEIICRLDFIKHMVSCKCVSKLWHHLISTICIPAITSSSPIHGLLFNTCPRMALETRGPWSFVCMNSSNQISNTMKSCASSDFPFHPSLNKLINCCDGLFLFFNFTFMRYYICNPSTMQYTFTPQLPKKSIYGTIAALFFDPNLKVVEISRKPSVTMRIFSSITKEWSEHNLDMDSSVKDSYWSNRCVLLNGSLYCLSTLGFLLTFDVIQICFKAIDLPKIVPRDDPERNNPEGCLGVSQGRLHYAWDDQIYRVMVWTFLETRKNDEWVLKYTICLQYFNEHPLCGSTLSVFMFHPTLDTLFVGSLFGIWSYHPETKELETMCTLRKNKMISGGKYLVYPFSINLTPLGTSSQSITKDLPGIVRPQKFFNYAEYQWVYRFYNPLFEECECEQEESFDEDPEFWRGKKNGPMFLDVELPLPDTFLDIDNTIQLPPSPNSALT